MEYAITEPTEVLLIIIFVLKNIVDSLHYACGAVQTTKH